MSKEVVVESEGVMEQCDTLAVNESICSFGVGVVDIVKQGSHGNGSEGKEIEANSMERSSNLDMGERWSIPIVEIGSRVSDDEEDFMSGLKELNEAIELKKIAAAHGEKSSFIHIHSLWLSLVVVEEWQDYLPSKLSHHQDSIFQYPAVVERSLKL
ncbi:hypothetical protein PIB30_010114 [Stylosanthes scabra]|uniref:Uncharacterized protein n=1 Tax=Stylosanthes scabra TaxID=79078 RepID=A0ABU6Y3J0_9FABA|nr:hypothetical protein [Stylosanthes scabra]